MPEAKKIEHLKLGGILFPEMDQADFTAPFEVLAKIPNSTFHVLGLDEAPIRDVSGLLLTPQVTLDKAPQLDLLLVPGGAGVNALMEDDTVLKFIQRQAAGAKYIFSVCTGSLLLGAAGLLKGRRATTHWASFHMLTEFGAKAVNERVVIDGKIITAAGVTSGIDGALRVAALLRDEPTAEAIQLYIQYAPEPPFNCGTPETASPALLRNVQSQLGEFLKTRHAIVKRAAARLG